MDEKTLELIRELRVAKQTRDDAEARVRELELALSEVCAKLESKTLEAKIDGEDVVATLVESARVVYDNEALRGMLGDRWNDVVKVTEKVDTKKLETLVKEGWIATSQISKAAAVKKSRAYFRLS